jgi:hypothetical protein
MHSPFLSLQWRACKKLPAPVKRRFLLPRAYYGIDLNWSLLKPEPCGAFETKQANNAVFRGSRGEAGSHMAFVDSSREVDAWLLAWQTPALAYIT